MARKNQNVETIESLKAQLAALQGASKAGLALKVSQKGALSVYGLGKWPVTLYREQWERLLDTSDSIRKFIKENAALLSVKERNGKDEE